MTPQSSSKLAKMGQLITELSAIDSSKESIFDHVPCLLKF